MLYPASHWSASSTQPFPLYIGTTYQSSLGEMRITIVHCRVKSTPHALVMQQYKAVGCGATTNACQSCFCLRDCNKRRLLHATWYRSAGQLIHSKELIYRVATLTYWHTWLCLLQAAVSDWHAYHRRATQSTATLHTVESVRKSRFM